MPVFLKTIVEKVDSLQNMKPWQSQPESDGNGAFTHFLNEWCGHLSPTCSIKEAIFKNWSQGANWQTLALENASPILFKYGPLEKWSEFWEALNGLTKDQSPLDICDELLDWGRNLLDKSTIESLLQATDNGHKPERRVLGVLPYQGGLLSLVLVGIPAHCLTPLHSHPECLAEIVLSGEIAELRFTQPNAKAFRYEKLEVLGPGTKTLCHSDSGSPHMMYAKTKNVVSLAVFAGDRPIEYFPKQVIENPDALDAAIASLEMKH